MLRGLYETDIRRGELLGLKFNALQESAGGDGAFLKIERNHHDEFDLRVSQPVAKNLGRIVPISTDTKATLLEYRDEWRAELPSVSFSENDFLFVRHRTGRSQGEAVTERGFNSALINLKKFIPELDELHPHLLRHEVTIRPLRISTVFPPSRRSGVSIDTITTWSSRASSKQTQTDLNDDPTEAATNVVGVRDLAIGLLIV